MRCRLWGESQDLFDFFEGKALVEELGGLGLVVVGEEVEDFLEGWRCFEYGKFLFIFRDEFFAGIVFYGLDRGFCCFQVGAGMLAMVWMGVCLFGLGLLGLTFSDAEEDFFESEGVFSEFGKFGSVVDECFGDAARVGGVGGHGDSDLAV